MNPERFNDLWGGEVRWPSQDAVMELIRGTAFSFTQRTDVLAHEHIWGNGLICDNEVFHSIRRTQLFGFLGALEPAQIAGGNFDFSGFDNGGPGSQNNVSGYIVFNGSSFFVSGWCSFSNRGFGGEHGAFLSHARLRQNINGIPDIGDVILGGAGLTASLFRIPFVSNPYKHSSNWNSGIGYINTVNQWLNRDAIIAGLNEAWWLEQYALMSNNLGGRIIFVETPNGNLLMANYSSQRSIIIDAYLNANPNIDIGLRSDRLAHITGDSTEGLDIFESRLEETLENYFDSLPAHLRERYSHVTPDTSLNDLPEAILNEVIRLNGN